MPKEHFTVAKTTPLSQVPHGGAIHVIGVSGVAMAQLAVALTAKGYRVSGSDKEFYEPMGSFLRSSPVQICKGYAAENIPTDVALVVIGNAVSYSNPEVLSVEARGLPYTLFPKLLFETLISGKHSIVVAGTHGKTTTSALLSSVLTNCKEHPSFFIGGAVKEFAQSLTVDAAGTISVVEGDEYDSSFFAKVPKFSFYAPNTLIVTSIEFDHADIYRDVDEINGVFFSAISKMTAQDLIIACGDEPNLQAQIQRWKSDSKARVITYGVSAGCDAQLLTCQDRDGMQEVSVRLPDSALKTFTLQLPGRYNALNALAVLLAVMHRGIDPTKVLAALPLFQGVKRRQDVRFESSRYTIVEDFAHHPTAVRETLAGIRARNADKRLIAVFEPRSNSSRRKVFQHDYVAAFQAADLVVLCDVLAKESDAHLELLNVRTLGEEITEQGVATVVQPDPDGVYNYLTSILTKGDVLLVMSNGSFGGLIEKLVSFAQQ
jgi:UDP-N-acetylmuramate: L-alanyl-gamma-D-glutamyl-meso-diaminopimelate ligase